MSRSNNQPNSNFTLGLVLLLVGVFVLLRKMGIFFPGWLFSWPVIFIVLGMVVLIKNRFQSGFGFLMLLFGSFFLLKNEFGLPLEFAQYAVPVGLIVFGLYLMVYKRKDKVNHWGNRSQSFYAKPAIEGKDEDRIPESGSAGFDTDRGDMIQAQAVFSGIQRRLLSRNFQGGKVSAIFGSAEIDLRGADFEGKAYLNVDVVCGGIKLILPPHWDLQINVTNVVAGVGDKRIYPASPTDQKRKLLISGSAIFGELEIKSF